MKSKYFDVARTLEMWMKERKLPVGARLPSTHALARLLDYPLTTTNRACQFLVARGRLRREGYKLFAGSEPAAASPSLGEVCIVSSNPDFARSAAKILSARGFSMHVVEPTERTNSFQMNLKQVKAKKPVGILVLQGYYRPSSIEALATVKVPLVVISNGPLDLEQTVVGIDLYRATEKAVNYLVSLGHRQIGMVVTNKHAQHNVELHEAFRKVCLQKNLEKSAVNIWVANEGMPFFVSRALDHVKKARPAITGLFGSDRVWMAALELGLVPPELSLVGYNDLPEGRLCKPALTSFAPPYPHALAVSACAELMSQIDAVAAGLRRLTANRVLIVPNLIVRESAKRREGFDPPRKSLDKSAVPPHSLPDPTATYQNVYSYLKKRTDHDWRQLDLAPLANHSMTRVNGWLGDEPLLHFSPGLRFIHGVPFQVLDEAQNEGMAVVTFRSRYTHFGGGEPLPLETRIPVNGSVHALYFLHGCGFAKPLSFASYNVHYANGKIARIPLVPLVPRFAPATATAPEMQKPLRAKTNIEDWWGEGQRDYPHAHRVLVVNPASPQEYQRTLYSLEWINPRPGHPIDFIKVRVMPEAESVMSLIAATALL